MSNISVHFSSQGLEIKVGKGNEVEAFMSRSWDVNPAKSWPLTHVAFAGWNNKMEYEFCIEVRIS